MMMRILAMYIFLEQKNSKHLVGRKNTSVDDGEEQSCLYFKTCGQELEDLHPSGSAGAGVKLTE